MIISMNKQPISRIWHTFRLWTILNSRKRADYLRNHQVFHHMGTGCTVMERKVPLCPKLISIGNNVHLAAKVLLVTHDAIHLCLNSLENRWERTAFKEKIGCIEIGDNVFIGSNSMVLYDVKIGSNVIIGAGSLVNKDVPANSVAVGIPIRVIGTFDDFVVKRQTMPMYPSELKPIGHTITKELEDWCWCNFKIRRE